MHLSERKAACLRYGFARAHLSPNAAGKLGDVASEMWNAASSGASDMARGDGSPIGRRPPAYASARPPNSPYASPDSTYRSTG